MGIAVDRIAIEQALMFAEDARLAELVRPILDRMLGDGKSSIDPSYTIWTTETAEDLRARIEDNLQEGAERNQWVKLAVQLDGAPVETVLMAAELTLLRDHPIRGARLTTRLEHLQSVLDCSPTPIEISEDVQDLLVNRPTKGGFEPGQGYYGALYLHLIWCAKFIKHWTMLPTKRRTEAQADPWFLEAVMLEVEPDRPDIRNVLLFLIRPDVFEPISSRRMKLQIRDALVGQIPGAPATVSGPDFISVDKDLHAIRLALASDRTEPFSFWDGDLRSLWDTQKSPPKPRNDEPRTTQYRDFVDYLENEIVGEDTPDPVSPVNPSLPPYKERDFLSEVFASEEQLERLLGVLKRKKNLILTGAPGVGKTYAAKRLAYTLMGVKDPSRVAMVQFHQSYSYEDFMMGYRPNDSGGFSLVEGPFYRFCAEASNDDPSVPYVFIIDEINRGNISKIFGELLMLIETDKRGNELRLMYKNESFTVPPNVFIIGMMNTADRSIALIDYALRRRFGFINITPGFETQGFIKWREEVDNPRFNQLIECVQQLNEAIAADPALGEGFCIGHSYFCAPSTPTDIVDEAEQDAWIQSIVEDELVPLLQEYWFDDPAMSTRWTEALRAAIS